MKKSKLFKTLSAFALLTTSVVVPTILSSCSTDNGNGNGNNGGSNGNNNGGNNNGGNGGNNGGTGGDNGGDNIVKTKLNLAENVSISIIPNANIFTDDSIDRNLLGDWLNSKFNGSSTLKKKIFTDELSDSQLETITVDLDTIVSNDKWVGSESFDDYKSKVTETIVGKETYEITNLGDLQNKLIKEGNINKVKFNIDSVNRNFEYIDVVDKVVDGELDKVIIRQVPFDNIKLNVNTTSVSLDSKYFELDNTATNLVVDFNAISKPTNIEKKTFDWIYNSAMYYKNERRTEHWGVDETTYRYSIFEMIDINNQSKIITSPRDVTLSKFGDQGWYQQKKTYNSDYPNEYNKNERKGLIAQRSTNNLLYPKIFINSNFPIYSTLNLTTSIDSSYRKVTKDINGTKVVYSDSGYYKSMGVTEARDYYWNEYGFNDFYQIEKNVFLGTDDNNFNNISSLMNIPYKINVDETFTPTPVDSTNLNKGYRYKFNFSIPLSLNESLCWDDDNTTQFYYVNIADFYIYGCENPRSDLYPFYKNGELYSDFLKKYSKQDSYSDGNVWDRNWSYSTYGGNIKQKLNLKPQIYSADFFSETNDNNSVSSGEYREKYNLINNLSKIYNDATEYEDLTALYKDNNATVNDYEQNVIKVDENVVSNAKDAFKLYLDNYDIYATNPTTNEKEKIDVDLDKLFAYDKQINAPYFYVSNTSLTDNFLYYTVNIDFTPNYNTANMVSTPDGSLIGDLNFSFQIPK